MKISEEMKTLERKLDHKKRRMFLMIEEDIKEYADMPIDREKNVLLIYEN